jgi:large subunit ribosomal protein L6
MSRVAKSRINLNSAKIQVNDLNVVVQGQLGNVSLKLHPSLTVDINKESNDFGVIGEDKILCGTFVRIIGNAVSGVQKPFEKKIQLIGVGYKFAIEGKKLKLSVGYSHDIYLDILEGITIKLVNSANIVISSCDKHLLGMFAARICGQRKYNPYKGTGIKDLDKFYRTKEIKKK